jgi:lipoate-protein ligase A
VLHGSDLTYCVVAGERDGFPPSVTAVYQRLSRGLQAGLARLGVVASPGLTSCLPSRGFNCFSGAATGDLTWRGKKFLGSAQAWQGRSFLQHGAILLTSQAEIWRQLLGGSDQETAAQVISLTEILGAPPSLNRLKTALQQGFQEELGLSFEVGELTPWEKELLAAEFHVQPCQ